MRREQPLRALRGAIPLLLAASCATADGELPDGDPPLADAATDAAAMDAAATGFRCASGVNVEADILAARCGTAGCHDSRSAAAGLDLRAPGLRARVTDAPSNVCAGRRVVAPGDPGSSVLVEKLLATNACGDRMPLGGPYLTAAEIDCVRAWVAAAPPPPRPDAGADAAAERTACGASDGDGDGFGTHPTCASAERDCDDRNGAVHPGAPEACNGADDDCDGAVDEGLGEGSCGVGACRRTVPFCVMGRPARCTPGAPAAETCNGLDDDCDGTVDEEAPGATCGTGTCARTSRCVGGRIEPCAPGAPAAEACNGMDDDCDGTVDEGFRAAAPGTGYSTLVTLHEGCNGTQRMGPDCNAAIHRFCARRPCATTGFGPTENSGDFAGVACVASDGLRNVSFDELTRQHPDCGASRERTGIHCNSAIHRWCRAQGFATGFGPVEQGATEALVACLRGALAAPVETTFTELAASHPGCTGGSRVWGPDCNAAIHRLCQRRGAVSGFGPVEYTGNAATVVCVSP